MEFDVSSWSKFLPVEQLEFGKSGACFGSVFWGAPTVLRFSQPSGGLCALFGLLTIFVHSEGWRPCAMPSFTVLLSLRLPPFTSFVPAN